MTKKIRRMLIIFAAIILITVVIEVGYFMTVLFSVYQLEESDLIVVFEGGPGRTRTAYTLVKAAYADHMTISPATKSQLNSFDRIYRPSQPFKKIIETKARTTFENALFTREIVKTHNFKSVILVTSWHHMPRSHLLLKTMLIDSRANILPYPVPTGKLNHYNWYRHTVGWKMVYNELVQYWGSLIELLKYRIGGKLPTNAPGKGGILRGLRQYILFEINSNSLNPNPP